MCLHTLLIYSIGNLDFTMITQMSRRGRLDAMLYDNDDTQALANILQSDDLSNKNIKKPDLPHENDYKNAISLTKDEYFALLHYLQTFGQPYRPAHQFPHPENALILPTSVNKPLQLHEGHHTFSCKMSHKGNSAIKFYDPSTNNHDTGYIESIWTMELQGVLRRFFVVRPHLPLPITEQNKAPFIHLDARYSTKIVDSGLGERLVIIEQRHIITHLTVLPRPVGTYGIERKTLVICWALNRGLK